MTTCWLISEPKAGMQSQCRALAAALGWKAEPKSLQRRFPWSVLPAQLWPKPLAAAGPGSDSLDPPWPDALLSCGRYAAGIARAIKRANGQRSHAIHIAHPRLPLRDFDLIVAPKHDGLSGPNVLETLGSLHGLSPAALAAAANRFHDHFANLSRPLVGVLVGGASRHFRFGPAEAQALAGELKRLSDEYGAGIALSISRRTPPEVAERLRRAVEELEGLWIDGSGDNPYPGLLALADHLIVTSDSVNMVSEACATGRPVHVYALPGGSRRLDAFHANMGAAGYTRPYAGRLDVWTYPPLWEAGRVAEQIHARLTARAVPR